MPDMIEFERRTQTDKVSFFNADYRDGRVHIGGKAYPAGTFATHLLNQYYENDTAARIAVFKQNILAVQRELEQGYINPADFAKCSEEISVILKTLSTLQPFSMLQINDERNRIVALFTKDNAERIADYLRRRARVADIDIGSIALGAVPKEYDKGLFAVAEVLLSDINKTLSFYDTVSEDMRKAFEQLLEFVSRVDEAIRFDEAHLLPIAMEVFGQAPFPVKTKYVSIRKTRNSKTFVTARRLYFESYYSFIITDFFEGLHYGHYPRQCPICKKYFLMQSAARQKYCSEYAPFKLKGKPITCRKYAARTNRKELVAGNPVIRLYKNRCSAIRNEQKRGTVTPEFAAAAKALAKSRMQLAKQNPEYANGQYISDMSREKLYSDTDVQMK
ncbi:MAG: DUF6076 domain-containing protein [Eubacteriales bacterium]